MTDYTDWTRTPIRFEDVKKGDVIEGEQMGDNNLSRSLSPTVVSAVDDADGHRKIQLPTAWRLPETDVSYGNWTLRKLTPPTPQWPEMAPLTSLGQMAEGVSLASPRTVLVIDTAEPTFKITDRYGANVGTEHSWSNVLDYFDPGTLHPITPEPVELTDEQVKAYAERDPGLQLTNSLDQWYSAGKAAIRPDCGPYSLIHYPKEK